MAQVRTANAVVGVLMSRRISHPWVGVLFTLRSAGRKVEETLLRRHGRTCGVWLRAEDVSDLPATLRLPSLAGGLAARLRTVGGPQGGRIDSRVR
jgi:hypothetical protein